ncbi:MAG: zinc ribbon domain-containing protein [Coriobacteriales bacterium]|jgi:hypothetical protein|nr:zinc ribbon domain-containing protein [Coriobacteriales bacterium]
MFCPNCGTQLPDTATFCGNCGTQLQAQAAQTVRGAKMPGSTALKTDKSARTAGLICTLISFFTLILFMLPWWYMYLGYGFGMSATLWEAGAQGYGLGPVSFIVGVIVWLLAFVCSLVFFLSNISATATAVRGVAPIASGFIRPISIIAPLLSIAIVILALIMEPEFFFIIPWFVVALSIALGLVALLNRGLK